MPMNSNMTVTPETDADLSPVRIQTLADQATERLRNAIQRGSLGPGAQLVERELADKLGMSRVPIREAIHRLAEEGLVKKTAHRGTLVYLPSPREIEEITSVRIVLEQLVTERALQRWNTQHEADLRAVVEDMRAAVQARNRRQLAELDTQFHTITWQIADHAVLSEMIASLRQRVTRLLYETIALMTDDELSGAILSHEWLIESFKRGNVAAAKEEISRHIAAAKDRILNVYQRTFTA
jgi:DNA-binding GntR family transcriptional regulator